MENINNTAEGIWYISTSLTYSQERETFEHSRACKPQVKCERNVHLF